MPILTEQNPTENRTQNQEQNQAISSLHDAQTEEVQELLGSIPGWINRWGITVVFCILSFILFAAWFIKYPEKISAPAVITTKHPPALLYSKASGRLHFRVTESQAVEDGDVIAYIENAADYEQVISLEQELKNVKAFLEKDAQPLVNLPSLREELTLGPLQSAYNQLLNSSEEYRLFQLLEMNDNQVEALESRLMHYSRLHSSLAKQKETLTAEFKIQKEKYLEDSLLFSRQALSRRAFNASKEQYLGKLRSVESLEANSITNDISISQLKAQILKLKLEDEAQTARKKQALRESCEQLISQLREWKLTYLILAPVNGQVTFMNSWGEDYFVKNGEPVVSVVPSSGAVFAKLKLPVSGSGKVKKGQQVLISCENFPAQEYGLLQGEIEQISLIPYQGQYTVRVRIPSLKTSYNKELVFKQEMLGRAEIITQDLRLIDRLLNQFRLLISKSVNG